MHLLMKEGNLNKFQMVRFQIWHSGKGKASEKVTSSMVARSYGKGGVNMRSTEDVQAVSLLNDTIMADTCYYTFVKTHRMWKVTPKVKYELWVTILCQCMFINCDKCTAVMQDIDSGVKQDGGRVQTPTLSAPCSSWMWT